MVKEEILAMEAGEELSQKVAEEIMGECYHRHYSGKQDSIDCLKCGESRFYHQRSQAYSTDISAVWQVVNKILEEFKTTFYLIYCKGVDQLNWRAIFIIFENRPWFFFVDGKTAPEAICKTALLAKLSL